MAVPVGFVIVTVRFMARIPGGAEAPGGSVRGFRPAVWITSWPAGPGLGVTTAWCAVGDAGFG